MLEQFVPWIGTILPIHGQNVAAITIALSLTLALLGPGFAWIWLIPEQNRPRISLPARYILTGAHIALLGTVLIALGTMILAETGSFSNKSLVFVTLGLMSTGIILGTLRGAWNFRRHVGSSLPTFGVTVIAFFILLQLPQRGNWIAGGWDPGIYVGQGVMVHRTGTFHPPPDTLLATLSDEEFSAFTRETHNFVEYLPVVPVDPDSRAIQPFFFRLFPSVVCMLYDIGGIEAAMRVNLFIGWLTSIVFMGMLVAQRRHTMLVTGAFLGLVTHPIWVFMAHFPTSEMLQLLFVCGLGLLLPYRFAARSTTWIVALVLLCAMLNRFSFLPFAGIYLCVCTWMDIPRRARDSPFRSRLLHTIAILSGALFDSISCNVTLARLDDLVPPLVVGGLAVCGLALVIEILAFHSGTRKLMAKPGTKTMMLGLLVAGLASWGLEKSGLGWILQNMSLHVRSALPYLGPVLILLAVTGFILVIVQADDTRTWNGFLLFLMAITTITFGVDAISSLYPWAMRRHLAYTLPLLVILATLLSATLWQQGAKRPASRIAAVIWICVVILFQSPKALDAARHTELNGLADVMADMAAQIDDNDIVVADHFRWGTPLKLIHGKQILNGELLWARDDEHRTKIAFSALRRLHEKGHRVIFVTSTHDGLSVFPGHVQGVKLWSTDCITLRELNHHIKQTGFGVRTRTKQFTLWEWVPKQ